jgi:hypothetical protein
MARSPKDGCDLLTGCWTSVLLGMTMRNFRLFAIIGTALPTALNDDAGCVFLVT